MEEKEVKVEAHATKEEKERLFKRLVESEDDDVALKKPKLWGCGGSVMSSDTVGKKKVRVGVGSGSDA